MKRFLQLASNLSWVTCRNINTVNSSTCLRFGATKHSIPVSSVYAKKYGGSSASSGGKKNKDSFDITTETVSDVGSKPNNKLKSSSSGNKSPQSLHETSINQKSKDDLSGAFDKMVITRSGYETRQRKGATSGDESPMVQGGKSVPGDSDRSNERTDRLSSGSVRHNKDLHRFTLNLGDNHVAHIDYKPMGKNKIELYYTEVPISLRGRGIGKVLAEGALECAAKDNYKLKVTCEYLEDYVRRFASDKYKRLVED